jgi:hypothetical protein
MDSAEALIEEIRVELDRLTSGSWPTTRWAVGQLKKQQHATLPRIEWEELGGTFEDARLVGGAGGNIGIDAAKYQITIWNSTTELCRNTMHALRVAARNVGYGPNVVFGDYTWIDDAVTKLGRKLTFQITMRLPILCEVAQTADVDATTHSLTVADEVIC